MNQNTFSHIQKPPAVSRRQQSLRFLNRTLRKEETPPSESITGHTLTGLGQPVFLQNDPNTMPAVDLLPSGLYRRPWNYTKSVATAIRLAASRGLRLRKIITAGREFHPAPKVHIQLDCILPQELPLNKILFQIHIVKKDQRTTVFPISLSNGQLAPPIL
jgi:hypothetical protein